MPEQPSAPRATSVARLNAMAGIGMFVGMESCLAVLHESRSIEHPLVRAALLTALAINYARAFESVRDDEDGLVRNFSTKSVVGFDRSLHAALINLRNGQLAHSGQEVNDLEASFLVVEGTAEGTVTTEDGETSPFEFNAGMRMGSRGRASLPFLDTEAVADLDMHLGALREASGRQILASLHEHQDLMAAKLDARNADRGRVVFNRTVPADSLSPDLVMAFSDTDLQFSLATAPAELPIRFASMFFTVRAGADPGTITLQVDIRTDHQGANPKVSWRDI